MRPHQQRFPRRRLLPSVCLVAFCAILAPATPLFGERDNHGNPNPGIHPPDSKPNGQGYGEWSARWWQWLLAIPAPVNPNLDATGANCGQGQSGQVWFLAGTFGGSANRTCTVPTGTSLLIPMLNTAFGAGVGDCLTPPLNNSPCDVAALRAGAAAQMDDPQTLELSIDGVRLRDLRNYRATSPVFFYTLPQNNVLSALGLPDPAGTYGPAVSDGYWVMFTPLPPGMHTIEANAVGNAGFGVQLIYKVFVEPGR